MRVVVEVRLGGVLLAQPPEAPEAEPVGVRGQRIAARKAGALQLLRLGAAQHRQRAEPQAGNAGTEVRPQGQSQLAGGKLLVTNVHSDNPGKHGMEHLLEWHLIYRNEAGLQALLPPQSRERKIYVDATGVTVFGPFGIA